MTNGAGIRVIVIGGAHYGGRDHVYRALDALNAAVPFLALIECVRRKTVNGRVVGAGYLAGRWAVDRGVLHIAEIPEPKRDVVCFQETLASRRPDIVIRFPGGKQTHRFAEIAAKRGLQIVEAK